MEEEIKKDDETVNTIEEANTNFEPVRTSSPLIEAAKAENDRRERLLKEEKALQERKERLHADQMLGGQSMAGQEPVEKIETAEELAERFESGEYDILSGK